MLELLDGLPVLDLTDHRGEVAGWMLGCLGADVVKIEGPGGCPSRREGPWLDHAGRSLQFEAYNHDKRSVMLDPAIPGDVSTLRSLVETSAIVLDTGPDSRLGHYGLDARWIGTLGAPVVYVQITPFGTDGPRSHQPWSELTIAALGGPVSLQGSPERAPVPVSVPQVWRHAGAEGAIAALVGRLLAESTGRPQIVDVAAQSVMTWTMLNAMEASQIQGSDFERTGATLELAMTLQLRHPTSDGFAVIVPRGATIDALLPAMLAEGVVGPDWADEHWPTWDQRVLDGEPTAHSITDITEAIGRFTIGHSKADLLAMGADIGLTMAPINTLADLAAFDHLEARRYWIDRPSGPGPGMFATVDGDRGRPPGPIPDIGQHTDDVRTAIRDRARPAGNASGGVTLPLEGLRVADFSWIGVGPITAKCLADHGATVVRVESANRLDGLRVQPPFKDGRSGLNRSNFFGAFNTSKLGLALDLKSEEGLRVARRLVEWADVVIDSFTPGVMAGLGLGPDDVRQVNPSAITVTTSLLGSGGPHSSMAGYGYHAAGLAGFFELVGYADGPPEGPWLAYTDTIGPRFITSTLLAALARRKRTGEGCHIEAAQLEIALQFLAPELLLLSSSATVVSRDGSRDPRFAPQGVYPCAGSDRWVAITVVDDAHWSTFTSVVGKPGWADDRRYDSVAGRHAHHDELDRAIAQWTSAHSDDEVEALLCRHGIAAGKVQRSSDLAVDPQYAHRRFYRTLEHDEVGPVVYAGHQYRIEGYECLTGSANGPRTAAPALGEHTFAVLTDLLGFDPDEVAEIAASGALE